ncbi:ATP-binding protein [[Clostridium] scindens]|uniref:AAA family ATPase n=1 Tax=Clostridium scindens (strain JCM 10418 / VPI 12708) TaxID=29347 RepID=UPI002096DA44|nr:AAA family ATPase [[Clostridium] scindens]MCO7172529.1 ATP-binding protein [[Clostridium] scindens]
MAIPVLIIGKSGSGKSASMKRCAGKDFNLVRVLNKPLPFRGKINGWITDDYQIVYKALKSAPAKSVIIDDAGYLITNYFMKNHSTKGKGNDVFGLYNTLGDNFWGLIQYIINEMPADKIVYVIMHEDTDDYGNVKAKTIGKLLDEKICLEGMFTIVLRSVNNLTEHKFITQSDGGAISKSPEGMFEDLEIPNDLLYVDNRIREYYGIQNSKNQEREDETL